jgi:glycerol-3-phosphate O-acyltransferase
MGATVELPVWLVVLGTVLVVIAFLDRIIRPSMRWYIKRRVSRTIERVNQRLQLKLQPFKLTERRVLIDRLVHDHVVAEAIERHAAETETPRDVVQQEVEGYAREIVPSFSAYAYFNIGARVSKWIARALYRVRLGAFDEATLARAGSGEGITVVFVMNHRSNVDYLLITYLASTRSALSYAVGEWAQIWPLSRIIQAMGAYFIRRGSKNPLYRKVLARYVRMATEAGVTQAIFPEGGLSRDGRLGPPKLGLLSYIVTGFEPARHRDVVFVPVGLNYDRVLEDRVLLTSDLDAAGAPRFQTGVFSSVRFSATVLWRRLTRRYHRFGYACASFGVPLSLSTFLSQNRSDDTVAALGDELTRWIGAVIPVLPVALVATVFRDAGERPMAMAEIKRACGRLRTRLEAAGAHCHVPRADFDYAVEVGMRMMVLRRIIVEDDAGFRAVAREAKLLGYYANSIGHLVAASEPLLGEPPI